jgi:hypothetical protein
MAQLLNSVDLKVLYLDDYCVSEATVCPVLTNSPEGEAIKVGPFGALEAIKLGNNFRIRNGFPVTNVNTIRLTVRANSCVQVAARNVGGVRGKTDPA